MNFASKGFFIFLPVVLLVYHLLGRRSHKFGFLLLASWFFYMGWNPWYVWVIIVTSFVDYAAGLLIERSATPGRQRTWLVLSLVSNLGLLAYFKYAGFFLKNSLTVAHQLGWPVTDLELKILLPLGISFHTFQGVSYTIDVYRGKLKAVRSFTDFALFVAFFPQLVAGPIVRAVEFLPQMVTPPRVTPEQVIEGLHWILVGMFKKLFLADRLAQFVDPVFKNPEMFDPFTHRWAVIAYAVQVYCDFSGYSDIAIGCAKWFGFELPKNFDFPYLAGSITDFWRRWHISLSTWLRDYLYISLGGNRVGTARTYFNLMLTFTLCGLWHGADWNFIAWGAFNGVLLIGHRLWDRGVTGTPWLDRLRGQLVYRVLAVLATAWLVMLGFVIFRSLTWSGCGLVASSLAGWGLTGDAAREVPGWVMFLVGLFVVGHVWGGLRGTTPSLLRLPPLVRAGAYAAVVVALIAFGPGTGKAFIYFAF